MLIYTQLSTERYVLYSVQFSSMCSMCVCVRERERERVKEKKRDNAKSTYCIFINLTILESLDCYLVF